MSKHSRGQLKNASEKSSPKLSADASEIITNYALDQQSNDQDAASHTDKTGQLSFLKHWWAIGLIALLALGAMGATLKYLEDSAKRQKATVSKSSNEHNGGSDFSALNPFVSPPNPPPSTPQLSKEYIYVGSRMLAVEDAVPAPPADLAVWRPSSGLWYVLGGQGSQQTAFPWGGTGDLPAPGDYDGDGKTDFCVFRNTIGTWYINYSSDGTMTQLQFGALYDIPVPADYDGDGRTDIAVYRPNAGYWYIRHSSTGSLVVYQWGAGTAYTPIPADYDGDGRADIAVWYDTTARFLILKSSQNYNINTAESIAHGASGDKPVPGDYDGDGRADVAIWRGNEWNAYLSSTQTGYIVTMGDPNSNIAVPNDYDADGKTDMAVWRPSDGMWHIRQSSNAQWRDVQWGQTGDFPVPAFYRR